ncbi:hypothetical protein [Octadecabacter sp. R77987]|uniref:hypothetical protein n=1 Tax=Octadecabacter sp. R77987 TaxID=3093874 RepID=UPI00366AEC9A
MGVTACQWEMQHWQAIADHKSLHHETRKRAADAHPFSNLPIGLGRLITVTLRKAKRTVNRKFSGNLPAKPLGLVKKTAPEGAASLTGRLSARFPEDIGTRACLDWHGMVKNVFCRETFHAGLRNKGRDQG